MSALLRTSALRATRQHVSMSRQQVRLAHFENELNHTLPTSVTNKPWFAFKMIVYTTLGFGIPFYAVHFHHAKAAT